MLPHVYLHSRVLYKAARAVRTLIGTFARMASLMHRQVVQGRKGLRALVTLVRTLVTVFARVFEPSVGESNNPIKLCIHYMLSILHNLLLMQPQLLYIGIESFAELTSQVIIRIGGFLFFPLFF